MRLPDLLIALFLLLPLAGCGGSSETTSTDQSELDAYLEDNPEAAGQAPPSIDED